MANLIEYIQSQVYENSTEDISGSIMQQVLTRMASDEGVVNVHTISGQTPFADYNNAQAARDAVPAGFKKLGLIITYKLSSGWYIDEFIGSATSGWSTASNWKCLGPISVSQNASTGKTTITIGSDSYDVATQPVSVSQNTETGKTEIKIGDTPALIVDNEPEAGSDNLVKSGGVAVEFGIESQTYIESNFCGLTWGGDKCYAADAEYNGLLIPLIEGARYVFTNAQNACYFDHKPFIGDSDGTMFSDNYIEGTSSQKFLLITLRLSYATTSTITIIGANIKERLYTLENELAYVSNTLGASEGTLTLTSADYSGLLWNSSTHKAESSTSDFNSFIVKVKSGQKVSISAVSGGIQRVYVFSEKIINGFYYDLVADITSINYYEAESDCYVMIECSVVSDPTIVVNLTATGIFKDVRKTTIDANVIGFGDSIMFMPYTGAQLMDFIEVSDGYQSLNCGVGGTRWTPRIGLASFPTNENEAWNCLDIVNLVKAWIANDFTNVDEAVSIIANIYGGAVERNQAIMVNNLKSVRPTDVEIFLFMAGANDLQSGAPELGNVDDDNITTISGSINTVIKDVISANPKAKIYLLANIVKWQNRSDVNTFSDFWTTGRGYKITTINERIEAIAKNYKFPFCDMYNTLGWNMLNFSEYFGPTETSHPFFGAGIMGRKVNSFMKANQIW